MMRVEIHVMAEMRIANVDVRLRAWAAQGAECNERPIDRDEDNEQREREIDEPEGFGDQLIHGGSWPLGEMPPRATQMANEGS